MQLKSINFFYLHRAIFETRFNHKETLIASAVGGLRDFLADGENALLFEDNDAGSLLSAYEKLDKFRSVIVDGGRKTADKYNWQSIAANLSDIYRSLL